MQCLEASTKILFIDDDPDDLLLFQVTMQNGGFENLLFFLPKTRAEEVVEYLHQCKPALPDVILVDIRMPMTDGVEVFRVIRAYTEFDSIPVLLVSASTYYLDAIPIDHPDLAVDGLLKKPISIEELTAILKLCSTV